MINESESGGDQGSSEGDAIKVFVRIRPPAPGDASHHQSVSVHDNGKAIIMQSKPEKRVFTFDQAININAQQESVFSAVGRKLIESCISGYNGTIFAYGQTGSGKTFTMLGPSEDADNFQHKLRGVIPRSFEHLFCLVSKEQELHGKGKEFLMKCTFLEIYHEQVYDLLDPSTMNLSLRESMKKGVYVDGLAEKVVTSASEAYQVLNSGWINRRVASTSMNRESSRSHAVFTIVIESKEQKSGVQNVKESHLNLVDLAGSERQKDSNAVGLRLKEAGSINKSLSVLGNCIMSLVDIAHGKTRHIPYRDSKLTFLLRDSLGGNAKTSIIACVHPDSRHYGETLSTLQFANRAKMIKNKAIVNEDTQGNVVSLQAEIRRLKETVQQLHSAMTPAALDVIQSQGPTNQDAGSSIWKERFVNAMMLRDKSESDQRPLQEQVLQMEELCKKKEKFLQSTKMIIKFRESRISQLEKSVQTKVGCENADEHVVDLKAEVACLKDKIEHNPVITKFAMTVKNLESELRQCRSSDITLQNVMANDQRVEELERLYKDLMVDKSNDAEEVYTVTPTCTPVGGDHISTASIEKYKSQIATLETQLQAMKQTSTEQKEAAEKREMELESEVTSQKKYIAELNTVLESQQLRSKLERTAHLQIVKTICTPKKTKYNLRNRVVMGSSSSSSTPNADETIEFEEQVDDLMSEELPDFMVEQANDALVDEVKQLQSSNNSLNQRIEEYEADAIKLKQHISKIDHQNAQFNEILQRERAERTTKGEKSDTERMDLNKKLETALRNLTYFEGEARDLKVLLYSSDKEMRDIKTKWREDEEERQMNISSLETRVLQLEMETSKTVKEYENVCEERDTLLQDVENAQDTVRYQEDLVRDLEVQLQQSVHMLEDTETKLENVSKTLAMEKHNHEQLSCRTQSQGEAQEKEILQLLKEKELLQQEAEISRVKLEQQDKTIQNLKGSTDAAQHIISTLQKQQVESKEAVAGYMARIEELRTNLLMEKNRLLDQTQVVQSLRRSEQELEVELLAKDKVNQELVTKIATQAECHNAEMFMVKEDMDCMTEAYERIQEEYSTTQREQENTQRNLKNLTDTLKLLQTQLEEKEASHVQKVAELQEKLKEAESRYFANCKLSEEQESLLEELDTLKTTNESLNQIIEEYECGRREKNEEIYNLNTRLTEVEGYQTELENLRTNKKELEYHIESERISHEERVAELTEESKVCNQQLTQTCKDLLTLQQHQKELEQSTVELQQKLTVASEKYKNAKDSSRHQEQDVERLIGVCKKYHEENADLKEQQTKLMEERMQCYQEIESKNAKIDNLSDENCKLVGHQNHKQKIHYTVTLKDENTTLREQLLKAQRAYQELKMETKPYTTMETKPYNSTVTAKENMPPLSSHSDNHVRPSEPRMALFSDNT